MYTHTLSAPPTSYREYAISPGGVWCLPGEDILYRFPSWLGQVWRCGETWARGNNLSWISAVKLLLYLSCWTGAKGSSWRSPGATETGLWDGARTPELNRTVTTTRQVEQARGTVLRCSWLVVFILTLSRVTQKKTLLTSWNFCHWLLKHATDQVSEQRCACSAWTLYGRGV